MSGLNNLFCAYEIFLEKFTLIYDQCFLLRTMKAKQLNLRESLIPLILPLKMLRSRMKAKFLILFELQSDFNQMFRPRGEFCVLHRNKGKRGLPFIFKALRFSRKFPMLTKYRESLLQIF